MLNGALLKPRSLGEIVRKDFRVRAASTIISGWVGRVDPAKRTADFVAGLRCYRLGRLVKDGEFFGHPTPAQDPGMAQLIGEGGCRERGAAETEPAVPQPASEASPRRRGVGDIVIRPLGPAIRSQTVIEDAVKVVVINSQHPLFRERKGDIWYQLETAASE